MRDAIKFVAERFAQQEIIKGAEIGVYQGVNANDMLKNIPKLWLFLVDDFSVQGGSREAIYKNIEPFCDRAFFLEMTSAKASGLWFDRIFDFVYIDGDHRYESFKQDLEVWSKKIKPGGVLCGHDWEQREDNMGVQRGIKKFIQNNNLVLNVGTSWVDESVGDCHDWWVVL